MTHVWTAGTRHMRKSTDTRIRSKIDVRSFGNSFFCMALTCSSQGFPQEFLLLFFVFFATADESPTIQLYSLNVDRPPCPIKEPACSIKEPLRPDETVLVAKALSLVLCGRWGSRRNRRFSLPKSIIGLVPVLGRFFILFFGKLDPVLVMVFQCEGWFWIRL